MLGGDPQPLERNMASSSKTNHDWFYRVLQILDQVSRLLPRRAKKIAGRSSLKQSLLSSVVARLCCNGDMSDLYHPRPRTLPPTLARLPPLTSLRAFVATARHLSFTRAAEELHVTSAAIGQQIRLLEDHLGKALFHRARGQLQLTEAGNALMPGLTDAFDAVLEFVARACHKRS